jgi:hypothetical protein
MKSTESLAYPLEFFQYEQADILQLFDEEHSSLKQKRQFAHVGSPMIEQDFLEKNFPRLSKSIRELTDPNDEFFGRFFLTHPQRKGDVHIDTQKGQPNLFRDFSLNIPVANCQDTYHEWFYMPDPHTEFYSSSLFWRNYDKGTLIGKYELNTPTILKVSIPHRINNPLDSYRIVLAIRTLSNNFNRP